MLAFFRLATDGCVARDCRRTDEPDSSVTISSASLGHQRRDVNHHRCSSRRPSQPTATMFVSSTSRLTTGVYHRAAGRGRCLGAKLWSTPSVSRSLSVLQGRSNVEVWQPACRSSVPPLNTVRLVSTSSQPTTPNKTGSEDDGAGDDIDVWYERGSHRTQWVALGFRLATLQSIYWAWYCIDFVPFINDKGISTLEVNPMVGVIGLTISIATNTLATVYPMRLISKLEYNRTTHELLMYTHGRFPLVWPTKTPRVFPMGELRFPAGVQETVEFTADPLKTTGHVPIIHGYDRKWYEMPFLMHIRKDEVSEAHADEFVDALTTPEAYLNTRVRSRNNQSSSQNKETRKRPPLRGVKLRSPRRVGRP